MALYEERDLEDPQIAKYFVNHMSAMTEEGLLGKSAIAAELAHRDAMIERLIAEINDLVSELEDQ